MKVAYLFDKTSNDTDYIEFSIYSCSFPFPKYRLNVLQWWTGPLSMVTWGYQFHNMCQAEKQPSLREPRAVSFTYVVEILLGEVSFGMVVWCSVAAKITKNDPVFKAHANHEVMHTSMQSSQLKTYRHSCVYTYISKYEIVL